MCGMSAEAERDVGERLMGRVHDVFAGAAFPAFMLIALALSVTLLLGILFVPAAPDGLGAFAEAFKVWCFGYDPATGSIEPAYVLMVVVKPLILTTVILAVWWRPLGAALRRPGELKRPAAAAVLAVSAAALGLISLDDGRGLPQGELPFPAEDLRTAHTPPEFTLTDHQGQPVSLADLRGRVVMVTAVYASCGETCPMILRQTRQAVDALTEEEQAELSVLGITLDATRDTPEVLARLAKAQEVSPPLYRFVTGEPAEVERVLDRFDVARSRDPETGVIDHANLFILIDRQGRMAYRLTLGEQQQRWLTTALRLLIAEPRPGGAAAAK